MSKIYYALYLSIVINGNILVQNIKLNGVKKIASILSKEEFVFLNIPVQGVRENSSIPWQLQGNLSTKVFENASISKIEPSIDSIKGKVPKTSVKRNHERQYISVEDFKSSRITLDDEVEMDETIYLMFSEKDRRDGYKRSRPEDTPYAVVIYVTVHYESNVGLCSGSLLTSSWVLTAAHCFEMDVDEVHVCAGASSKQEISESKAGVQVRTSKNYYKHPDYSSEMYQKLKFDIAMVKVDEAFKMTSRVKTVHLRKSEWTYGGYKACMLTGFGSVHSDKEHDEDQTRKTHYLEVKNTCPCLDRSRDDILMCSRPREDYGLCGGDSGGGLICDGKIVAVACAIITLEDIERCVPTDLDCGGNNTLSVFQKTGPYLDWIHTKLNRASTDRSCHQIAIGVLAVISIVYQITHKSF